MQYFMVHCSWHCSDRKEKYWNEYPRTSPFSKWGSCYDIDRPERVLEYETQDEAARRGFVSLSSDTVYPFWMSFPEREFAALMQTLWNHLETQLQRLAPSIKESLQPGASNAELGQAETFLSITFPEEVQACYRVHDGQRSRTYPGETTGIMNGWFLKSLKSMCSTWSSEWQEFGLPGSLHNSTFPSSTEEYYPVIWHPQWLPFMGHWLGPSYCIDLAPGPKGTMGQILLRNDRHKEYPDLIGSSPSIRVVAPGIQEFFQSLTSNLEAGMYMFDEASGMLWDKEMLLFMSTMQGKGERFDEETGIYVRENILEHIKRKRHENQRTALPMIDGPDWKDLYRDHPIFGEPINFDEYPF